jgi:polyhydroxybutyrate depolymerase
MKKLLARLFIIVIASAVILVLALGTAFLTANKTNGSLISSGEKRTYLLYVPASYDPAVPTPLVISIHGYAEWPAHQMQLSHWNDLADQYGFIVVYPSGTDFPMRWRTTPGSDMDAGLMPDVVFISDLIDSLAAQYNLDPTRIYVNGLSNGGGMSMTVACMLSERIAAAGSVAGAYLFPWSDCQPTRQVPVILFHGTDDPIVPFEGGPSRSFSLPFPSIPDWVGQLAQFNGCSGESIPLLDSGDVSGIQYLGCYADVVFYTIAGGGHAWPGGEPLPEFLVGHTTQDIDATRTIWEFFQRHPLITQ